MENKKLYIIISIISLMLMIPSCVWNYNVLNMFSGIGCSGIAASIMAIYIERNSEKKEASRLAKAKSLYFYDINSQLNMIFERIMWFDDRMNDSEFNWSLRSQDYSSLQYMLWANINYKDKESMSFDEAEKHLKKIGEKYNLEMQEQMTDTELAKVQKMFRIIASSGNYLLTAAHEIEKSKLMLDTEKYLAMDKIDSLLFDISMGIGIMNLPNKNYSAAISCLLAASKIIREVGQYEDTICIGLHGSIQVKEL